MAEGSERLKRTLEGFFFAFILMTIALAGIGLGVRRWLPPLASEHGAGIDRMIRYLLLTVGTLFVIGHVALGYFIWRFSRQERVTYRLASPRVEKLWSLIPGIVMALVAEGGVLVIGLPIWQQYYLRPAPPDAVLVEVTAEQFAWNIRYPGRDGRLGRTDPHLIRYDNPLGIDARDPASQDDVVQLGVMPVPLGRPVHVRLRSKDTLHSFFLPHFRVKQDAVPGMTIDIWFTPTQTGEFEIVCAELCGFGHFQMRGVLRVLPSEDFERWLAEQPTFSSVR